MSGHTPGPWEPKQFDRTVPSDWRVLAGNGCVMVVELDRRRDGNYEYALRAEADARLIAAAPELLEALKRLTEGMEASGGWTGDDDLFDAAMAAIAKAEGR